MTSAFHRGEEDAQARLGLRERLAPHGQRVIRDFMPDQHRTFFAELPFVLVGSLDGAGRPWASLLAGPPGFASSPDPRHLALAARPLPGDPLVLAPGAPLGLLGIQPATRRRNRMNGAVVSVTAERAVVRVKQSFGNCPKYIQARTVTHVDRPASTVVRRSATLDPAMQALVRGADTFYVASAYDPSDAAGGVDVSHRGGKPGFVRVDGDRTLTVPDFTGNFYFNTVGNLLLFPRAGLLFIDFDSGDRVHLTADAEVVWSGPEVDAFAGAERILRFQVREAVAVAGPLPLRWGKPELSPFLGPTGAW